MGRRRPVHPNLAFTVVVAILTPIVRTLVRREDRDAEKLPTGGAVIALNHVSHFDPLVTGLFVHDHGILPSYLVKESLFRNRFLAGLLRSSGQIEVKRMTTEAVGAHDQAIEAVRAGKLLCVYPEGTLTRDPDLWPMRGKTGTARIALATGVPVIPVAHWGVHELLAPYSRRLNVLPRKRVVLKVGDPVDLTDLMCRELTPAVIMEATDRVMSAIVSLVEELRGEQAPPDRFDPRSEGVAQIGNPHLPQHRTATRRQSLEHQSPEHQSPEHHCKEHPTEEPQNQKDDDA